MSGYFKPLRRKIGVMALAMACLFATDGSQANIQNTPPLEGFNTIVLPYWPIVIPLTVLSTWLLISVTKPAATQTVPMP